MASVPGLEQALERGSAVYLRHPTAADEVEFRTLRAQSEAFLREWEPLPPDGSWNDHRAFEALLRANHSRRYDKVLVCLCSDGRIAGYIGVNEIVHGAAMSGFLGYWIGARFARQGYMSRALRLMLRRAFSTLGLHRLEANIIPGNIPSRRLVQRIGFRQEGVAKALLHINGRWQDHERWALLKEEFVATTAAV